jgi:ferric-dicitrate binding protein FerR (iron transport regulator)
MNVEHLLQRAGHRPVPAAERRERARRATRDAWADTIRARSQRRRLLVAIPALAAAAALVVAVVLQHRSSASRTAPVIVAVVAATTALDVIDRPAGSLLAAGDALHAGATVRTTEHQLVALALEAGGELRVNGGSSIQLVGPRRVRIDEGQIYVDSGAANGAEPLAIETFAGIVRDIGTRFDVQVQGDRLRVRVRDGAVRLQNHDVTAGRELTTAGHDITLRSATTYGRDWDWILRARPLRVEGATLERFLGWVEADGGRHVEFRDARLRGAVANIVLHGSVDGLSVDEALAVILPATGLTYSLDGSRVLIDKTTRKLR